MRYGNNDAHLDLLAVASRYRRAGVGRRLLKWLEKCAVVAGTFNVALEVRVGNEEAQLFYKHMGYRVLAHVPGYYQGIEAALRMGGCRAVADLKIQQLNTIYGIRVCTSLSSLAPALERDKTLHPKLRHPLARQRT
jgi:hypothetical protein